MAQSARVILYTSDASSAPELRRQITAVPRVKIVAELDEPSLLPQAASQFPADILIADLGQAPDVVLECVSQLRQSSPNLVLFALSGNTDGNLVLRAMRCGIKEYLVKPIKPEELAEAVERAMMGRAAVKQPGKLISVIGTAGGVGASVLATNLAVELNELVGGAKVAIVDLDFRFGQVATMLDIYAQFTVADLCATPEQIDPDMIMKALVKHDSGLYILSRPHSFAQAEMITSAHCASVLSGLQDICEYVVVDGPTRHDPGGRTVLDASDYCLLVLQLLVTCVRNADRVLQELANQGFNPDRVQLICNRPGRESANLEVSHVEQTLNRKIFATIPDDWKAVSHSVNMGQPLAEEFGKSKVRQAIQQLARMLHEPDSITAETKGSGLIGKLFGKGSKAHGEAAPVAGAARS